MVRRLAGLAVVLILGGTVARGQLRAPAFDHAEHVPLFPGSCTTCHLGAQDSSASVWPDPVRCAACHDGSVETRVEWSPPATAPPSNLRFTHPLHRAATADTVDCRQCHTLADSGSAVFRRLVNNCVGCHLPGEDHLGLKNDQCGTCHVPLAEAKALSRDDVAGFPTPTWHQESGFGLAGHGKLAQARTASGGSTVAQSCATCHARDFCIQCHVNAPEIAAIQALARDPRSLVHRFTFAAPATHAAAGFLSSHGRMAQRNPNSCAACHTQSSCTTCHQGVPPKTVSQLRQGEPDRGRGAQLTRQPPASHTGYFREQHSREANATPRACATCHARSDCLVCHRPDLARPAGGGDFHPGGFLVKHPAAAYARQTTCSDCHNYQQFCVSCHAQAGLNSNRGLGSSRFHDAKAGFILGHGQAARQSLESCVSCHVERNCTACHGAVGRGFGFNPHGPGFDPVRLRKRNPEMCIACHGQAIPGLP
jgi:hypothetical protein